MTTMQSINGVTYVRVSAHEEKERRKPNFTEAENLFLVEQFEKFKSILTSKVINSSTNKKKQRVWQLICNEVNVRNPGVKRLPIDIKRKWKNMIRVASHDPNVQSRGTDDQQAEDENFTTIPCSRTAINKRIFEIRKMGGSAICYPPSHSKTTSNITPEIIPPQEEVTDKDLIDAEDLLQKAESDFIEKATDPQTQSYSGRSVKSDPYDSQPVSVEIEAELSSGHEDNNFLVTEVPERRGVTSVKVSNAVETDPAVSAGKPTFSDCTLDHGNDELQTMVLLPRPGDTLSGQDNSRPVPRVTSVVSHAFQPHHLARNARLNRTMGNSGLAHNSYGSAKRFSLSKTGQSSGRFVRQQYSPRFTPAFRRPQSEGHEELTRLNRELLESEKGKIELEKEKIKLENVKLGLEIELLRKQLYGETYEELQEEIDMD